MDGDNSTRALSDGAPGAADGDRGDENDRAVQEALRHQMRSALGQSSRCKGVHCVDLGESFPTQS